MVFDNITKHPDLWFEDGNVVLIAEATGFRVYRGLLAKHSKIFRDMFSIPQPPSAVVEEAFEGCPVVRLADDRADDVAIILGILYEGGESFYKESHRIPFRTVTAALQLGTKYSFDAIRREALRRISICFPKDLKVLQGHGDENWFGCTDCPIIWDDFEKDPIAILHFARRLGLDDFIPAALYRCAFGMPISNLFLAFSNQGDPYYTLSLEELQDCIKAREYMFVQNVVLQETFANNLSPSCHYAASNTKGFTPCQLASMEMSSTCLSSHFLRHCDVFADQTKWISRRSGRKFRWRLCGSCVSHYITAHQLLQEETWSTLRSRFGSQPNVIVMDQEAAN